MEGTDKSLDIVAIGDITTDAFIRLLNASVSCDINKEHCTISMKFGDKIPYQSVAVVRAVGNAPNAAVSAARLGLQSALVSNLGSDINGKECLESLEEEGVNTKYITVHKDKETNYHYVLWYEDDRTILVKHQNYEYHLPSLPPPSWVYLSSLGESTRDYHKEIAKYLEQNPDVKLAFQPGTFQILLGAKELKDLYRRAEVCVVNTEEAERILDIKTLGIGELLKRLHALGPKMAIITAGPKGAYLYDGKEAIFMPSYKDPRPPLERTGAGDAFASTFVSATALGNDVKTALSWAMVNSMSVVQDIGAQKGLLGQKEIEEWLSKAPPEFAPEPFPI